MLGLRRIGNIQIDVWVGDGSQFDCDIKVASPGLVLDQLHKYRHVSLLMSDDSQASLLETQNLATKIKETDFPSKGRLTLISSNLEHYQKIKELLFGSHYIAT